MATEKTVTGLPKNTAASLSYVLGWVTGLVFLLVEKDPFIRFHAAQSVVVFGLISLVFFIPFVGALALVPLSPLVFILWLVLVYKAWQGEEWGVPFLSKYVRALVKKAIV